MHVLLQPACSYSLTTPHTTVNNKIMRDKIYFLLRASLLTKCTLFWHNILLGKHNISKIYNHCNITESNITITKDCLDSNKSQAFMFQVAHIHFLHVNVVSQSNRLTALDVYTWFNWCDRTWKEEWRKWDHHTWFHCHMHARCKVFWYCAGLDPNFFHLQFRACVVNLTWVER